MESGDEMNSGTKDQHLQRYLEDFGARKLFERFARSSLIDKYPDLVEVLLSDRADIFHAPPGLVRESFNILVKDVFDTICRRNFEHPFERFNTSLNTIHHVRRVVWKVVRQLSEESDRKLKDLITEENIRQIRAHYGPCSYSELEHRLEKISKDRAYFDGKILIEATVDRSAAYPHLLPIGRTLYWLLPDDISDSLRAEKLDSSISESYCLPPTESCEFLFWKYAYELLCESYENNLIWRRQELLKKHRLIPNAHLVNCMKSIPDNYYVVRRDLLRKGVEPRELEEIERKFEELQKQDLHSKRQTITHNAPFVIAMILDSSEPLVFVELQKRSKRLLKDVIRHRDESIMMWQRIGELGSVLKSNLLLFCVFYDYVYPGDQMIESSQALSNLPRRGIPKKWMEDATDSLVVDLINAIKDADIPKPFELGAKVLNALSDSDLYPRRADETFPSKSVGAEVLRKKYERMLNQVTPVSY